MAQNLKIRCRNNGQIISVPFGTSLKELPELPAAAAFDTAALHKPIGKGETVEVEVAYELRDNETDVRTNIFVGGHMTNQKKFEKILSIR